MLLRKDILGNDINYECMGCAIGKGEMELPGGVIYKDEPLGTGLGCHIGCEWA